MAPAKIAAAFVSNTVGDFANNVNTLQGFGYKVAPVADHSFIDWLTDSLKQATAKANSEVTTILVDVSSFSRFRLAAIVQVLADRAALGNPVRASFYYSLAEYSPPNKTSAPPLSIGPVLPELAGWYARSYLPTGVLLGLGYEPERAVATIELLQPDGVWAFEPRSPIDGYLEPLRESNELLYHNLSDQSIIAYDPLDAVGLHGKLLNLAAALRTERNINIVPGGPKIFALNALLLAVADPSIQITRVTPGDSEPPADRIASKYWTGLEANFSQRGATNRPTDRTW
jgi:hypothetical protein